MPAAVRPWVTSTGVTVDSSVALGSLATTMVPWTVKSSHPLGTPIRNPS